MVPPQLLQSLSGSTLLLKGPGLICPQTSHEPPPNRLGFFRQQPGASSSLSSLQPRTKEAPSGAERKDTTQGKVFRLNLSIPVVKLLAILKLAEYQKSIQHNVNIINFKIVTAIKQWDVITYIHSTNCAFSKIPHYSTNYCQKQINNSSSWKSLQKELFLHCNK